MKVRAGVAESAGADAVDENEIGDQVIDAAFRVHTVLGPGLLESVYEAALSHELTKRNLRVDRQLPVPVQYDGADLGVGFRIDVLVEDKVLVELKSVESLTKEFRKVTLNYLKLGGWKLGYLINFNQPRLKDGIVRMVNGLPETPRLSPQRPPRTPRALHE